MATVYRVIFQAALFGALLAAVLWGVAAQAALKAVEVPDDEPAAVAPVAPARTPGQPRPGHEFYDRESPAYERLQNASEALGDLPRDRDGKVDWMPALNRGMIKPRERIDDKGREPPLDLDVILRNTKQMPHVRFPHRAHTEWLDCSNCHPDPFATKAGSATIKMEDIFRGQFCGKCHDRVAFVTHRNCYRCHSVNPDGSPALPPASLPVHPASLPH